jgi:hypothetical protein
MLPLNPERGEQMNIRTSQPAQRTAFPGALVLMLLLLLLPGARLQAQDPFLPTPVQTVSTVPANGDLNPYGAAFVPSGFPGGALKGGDLLVSNFNNAQNLQGTGTTIVRITPGGSTSTFFQGQAGLGLTTALAALQGGIVLVGNMPTTDGTCATAAAGSLLVIDRHGNLLANLQGADLDGPWDLTVNDNGPQAQIFVSNVLSGTVTRLDVKVRPTGLIVENRVRIASGYVHRCDPAALVLGPTGLVYDSALDLLYVASTADNEIFAVRGAGTRRSDRGKGRAVDKDAVHLHGPIAMALAPNGHLLAAQGDAVNADANQPSEVVEFTTAGEFVKELQLDPKPDAAFGIAVQTSGHVAHFAAVNDNNNTVTIWTLPAP